jgi:hypothetical protein
MLIPLDVETATRAKVARLLHIGVERLKHLDQEDLRKVLSWLRRQPTPPRAVAPWDHRDDQEVREDVLATIALKERLRALIGEPS